MIRRLAYAAIGWELLDLATFAVMVGLYGSVHEANGLIRSLLDVGPTAVVGVKVGLIALLVLLLAVFADAGWRTRLAIRAAFLIGGLVGLYGALSNTDVIVQNLLTSR